MSAPEGNGKPWPEQPAFHSFPKWRPADLTSPFNARAALEAAQQDPKNILVGAAVGMPSIYVAQVTASLRPDFIWLDFEHSPYGRRDIWDTIHAIHHHSEGHTFVIARVSEDDDTQLATALDAGVSAIILPHSEDPVEIEKMVKKCRYPPHGHRSFSPWIIAPGIWDKTLYPDDKLLRIQNNLQHVAVIAQIESVKGIENMEAICQLEGVDGVMMGPGDWHLDAGLEFKFGAPPHQKFVDAITHFTVTAKKYNKAIFGGAPKPEMIPMAIASGASVICVSMDLWALLGATQDNLTAGKNAVAAHVKNLEEAAAKTNGVNGTEAAGAEAESK